MKKYLFMLLFFTTAVCFNLNAQFNRINGSGNVTKSTRNVATFTGVTVGGSMNVTVIAGKQSSVVVETDDNLQEYLETTVKDGVLLIMYAKGKNIYKITKAKVTVTNPSLDKARLSGSGTLKTEGRFKSSDLFEASVSGSGRLFASFESKETKAAISGSGNMELSGSTERLSVAISGSGNFKGYELTTKNTTARISGSGNVQTQVDGKLEAMIAGSGSVYYKGDGSVDSKIAGSGRVRKVN